MITEHDADAAYRSTIQTNQSYYNQGATWNSTIPQQPVNSGYAQQGGAPAASALLTPISSPPNILWAPTPLHAAPARGLIHVLCAAGPSTSTRSSPVSVTRGPTPGPSTAPLATPGKRSGRKRTSRPKVCNFLDANGHRCGEKLAHSFHRHLVTCHAFKELKAIQSEKLAPQHAKIITSDVWKALVEGCRLICPVCRGRKIVEGKGKKKIIEEASQLITTYSRTDHLRRHLRDSCIQKYTPDEMDWIIKKVKRGGWRETVERLNVEGWGGFV